MSAAGERRDRRALAALPPEQRDFPQEEARGVLTCAPHMLQQQLPHGPQEPLGAAPLRRENSGEDLRTHASQLLLALEYYNGLGGLFHAARGNMWSCSMTANGRLRPGLT